MRTARSTYLITWWHGMLKFMAVIPSSVRNILEVWYILNWRNTMNFHLDEKFKSDQTTKFVAGNVFYVDKAPDLPNRGKGKWKNVCLVLIRCWATVFAVSFASTTAHPEDVLSPSGGYSAKSDWNMYPASLNVWNLLSGKLENWQQRSCSWPTVLLSCRYVSGCQWDSLYPWMEGRDWIPIWFKFLSLAWTHWIVVSQNCLVICTICNFAPVSTAPISTGEAWGRGPKAVA